MYGFVTTGGSWRMLSYDYDHSLDRLNTINESLKKKNGIVGVRHKSGYCQFSPWDCLAGLTRFSQFLLNKTSVKLFLNGLVK